ncbi:ATP-dependent zinc protease [Geitlerinema sp. P-1104]|uniref:ATP-dependent zinc protease family protein n=1 Tax=Geitlerinema sp. P-1104 TaxID=2546230 RepID=UPI001476DF22|nr:RimK/LysX family protein [Geitlerinema sp. P-1104]NMG59476.1 ATP-dependent zinc protease [Geitlerinema sp. P-1104]
MTVPQQAIGWREWLTLPELGISQIKAKIDTGARSSALHAYDIKEIPPKGDRPRIRFKVHPQQRDTITVVTAEADILDRRDVRNSGGKAELRYVILTPVQLGQQQWPIELTLTNRDVMGFRMLLGRQAVRGRFLVDPGHSYLLNPIPHPP